MDLTKAYSFPHPFSILPRVVLYVRLCFLTWPGHFKNLPKKHAPLGIFKDTYGLLYLNIAVESGVLGTISVSGTNH